MLNRKGMGVFVSLFAALLLSSCGGGSSSPSTSNGQASVFTVGTDAPLPSIVSCQLMVTGITIFNGTTNVSVLSTPQIVDFAQFNGLHQLLDLNAVPNGTYTSATVTIASPVIGYINVNPPNPPTASTINGTLSVSSVTVNFPQPFVLDASDLVGLRMEFDLRQSLQVDGNGQVTGVVNPVFEMNLLNATDAGVSIDDFHAGVIGVTGANTFTVQGPHGRQWQVTTNDSTVFDDPDIPMSSFTASTIVSLTGTIDPVSHAIDASEVEVISNDKFFLGGLLTYVNPASPQPATQADIYVREELPAISGISDGQIETLSLNGSERYRIGNINLPLTTLLFSNTLLAPGQRVDIGGPLTTSNGTETLTVHRVILRRQGQSGSWVSGSTIVQSGNAGSFQLTDDWTAGILLPAPLTVLTTNDTNFINLTGLGALSGPGPIQIRVVGFILINQANGQPVMVARSVEQLTS
ncbi:MAG: DUF4382 domain-containing protein [Candidatus Acidiferrales bacterium]|jgi:hypothetical protein